AVVVFVVKDNAGRGLVCGSGSTLLGATGDGESQQRKCCDGDALSVFHENKFLRCKSVVQKELEKIKEVLPGRNILRDRRRAAGNSPHNPPIRSSMAQCCRPCGSGKFASSRSWRGRRQRRRWRVPGGVAPTHYC